MSPPTPSLLLPDLDHPGMKFAMSPDIQLTLKSQRACAFCRDRKQSCDKSLPKCSRCDLKDRHCDYSLNRFLPRSETVSDPSQQTLGPKATIREPCGCLEVNAVGEIGVPDCSSSPGSEPAITNTRDLYIKQLFRSVVATEINGEKSVIDRYLQAVQRWLPILSKEALLHETTKPPGQLQACFDVDSSLLFLAMRLVSQGRCSALLHDSGTNSFYLATRRSFLLFQDESHWSLRLLQAGILIATYECGHGLARSSYLTLASCVAMARLMRIDQDLAPQLNAGSEDAADPQVLCWSAIVVLDRLIALASVNSSFPLLVSPPPDSFFETSLECLQTRLAASKEYERNHWSFESTAAAAEMIGEALTYVPNSSRIPIERLALVKSRTDKLATVLLNISQIAPLLTCEVAPLSLSALAAVRLKCATSGDERFTNNRSVEELRSTFEMKLDEIRMFPSNLIGPRVTGISLLVLCSIFRSVLHLARYFHKDLLPADSARIRSGLLILRKHWSLGDLYLKELDDILTLSK